MNISPRRLAQWRHHRRDEADAAYLYRELAAVEPHAQRAETFRRLAEVEDRHTALWDAVLREHGVVLPAPAPSVRARLLAWVARRFGPAMLTRMLLREEGGEVRGYLALHRDSDPGAARDAALVLARESAAHAETLRDLAGASGEPWHQADAGDFVRNVVYGFNDGLTANFGLVAGVVGAVVDAHVIIISGIAGTIADALSMGSSSYLAAKSQREIYQHEIEMEREELLLMPAVEEEELALLYEAKGIDAERAKAMAGEVMRSPQRALEEKTHEELKIAPAQTTPLREGVVTGTATAVGAFIPVAPFLLLDGQAAAWTSFGLAMAAHFAVGAARSLFTGRGMLRSGLDMFLVGLGVAAAAYVVGDVIMRLLL